MLQENKETVNTADTKSEIFIAAKLADSIGVECFQLDSVEFPHQFLVYDLRSREVD